PKQPVAVGTGGAAATVDALATSTALRVLQGGGNAVDAAVAAAAVLGVTEPYSAGIGGGGFLVLYRAADRRVFTIDGRETAPAAATPSLFVDPATGATIPFDERVTSGLGVGVPGTVAQWDLALRRFGTLPLATLLGPAERAARRGFVVDQTFVDQTAENAARFATFPATAAIYLDADGTPRDVGTVLRNPDLAATYRAIARGGAQAFYRGPIARDLVRTVTAPPVATGTTRRVRAGAMAESDLRGYRAVTRRAVASTYRGYRIWGMAPPSSGGTTVAQVLNMLESLPATSDRVTQLHRYLEASRLTYADRGAYLGDPAFTPVPQFGLISERFAAERAALIGPRAATSPVAAGNPWAYYPTPGATVRAAATDDTEGQSTTHLTVSDRQGNVVSYTFTIESTGGSGIVVPGRGFLLNNELTDFDAAPTGPNAPAAGKRPRSSIAPTLVTRGGRMVEALGSPGGSTIPTTVLQTLIGQIDFGLTLPEAIAAPRASQRNTAATVAEPAFITSAAGDALRALGHTFTPMGEIGAVTGIAFLRDGRVVAAAEPFRRGGGSAMVERPRNPLVGPTAPIGGHGGHSG
ncbi:MAG: Gamma-glutamyltranspeptidase @ Glutathione hydrolase, partial [uncultured Thermoleophilia bacterium]